MKINIDKFLSEEVYGGWVYMPVWGEFNIEIVCDLMCLWEHVIDAFVNFACIANKFDPSPRPVGIYQQQVTTIELKSAHAVFNNRQWAFDTYNT